MEEDGAEPLYHLVLCPYSHHTGESLFPFFGPYCHTLIVSPMSPNLKFSIKDLKFCKECMSIGLYQLVFSQFSVASISVCYLSHSSSDLNQRWRLQKILNAPLPHPPSRVNRKVCIKANLTPKVISYWRTEGGEGSKVARGWKKMSPWAQGSRFLPISAFGEHARRLFFIPTCLTVDIEASQWRSPQSGGKFLDQSTAWKNLSKTK